MQEKQTELTPAFHADALVPWQPVAQWLSLSQTAIQKLIRQGLPVTRLNQRVLRFRKSEIEAWLAEKKA
jgi:predicted DNA-binding transcriptional regulator AlpA